MDILINQRKKRVFVNGVLVESSRRGVGIKLRAGSVNINIASFPKENRYSICLDDDILEEARSVSIRGQKYIEYSLRGCSAYGDSYVSYISSSLGDCIHGPSRISLKDGCSYGTDRQRLSVGGLISRHKSQRGHVWYAD